MNSKYAIQVLILSISMLSLCTAEAAFSKTTDADQTERSSATFSYLLDQAEKGNPRMQYHLAEAYAEGTGISQNDTEALNWYTRAALQGYAVAQEKLGEFYAEGRGISADAIEAYTWYLLAEINGKYTDDLGSELGRNLSVEQVQEAQKRVELLKQKYPKVMKYISRSEGFSVHFPSPPERTVVKEGDQVLAVYYQSMTNRKRIQYNISFQFLQNEEERDEESQHALLKSYLVGRASHAMNKKLFRKFVRFRGFHAAMFKHQTVWEGKKTMHEGIVCIMQNTYVTLTCVYPLSESPTPAFNTFMNSFDFLPKDISQ